MILELHQEVGLNILQEILKILPHRDSALYIDRVISFDLDSIHAQFELKATHHCLVGHFPDRPIMPAFVMIECISQAGAILLNDQRIPVIVKIEKAKFRTFIEPDAILDIFVQAKHISVQGGKFSGFIMVEEIKVCEVVVLFKLWKGYE